MGCVASKVMGKEEEMVMRRCKERKRLMKQLVGYREEFAAAQVWYLRSLRNTGATLRQFADLDHHHHHMMSSPPPALPPSPPPPPPPFAPDDDDVLEVAAAAAAEESHCIELAGEGDDACTPPPPPERGSSWDFWDPFGPPPPPPPPPDQDEDHRGREEEEEEYWADTKTEFGEEEEEEDQTRKLDGIMVEREVMIAVDDCSSMLSKDTDTAMAVWSSKKTLAGIMKELDHYFLEASSGVQGLPILLENNGVSQLYHGVVRDFSSRSKSFSFSFTVLSLSLQLPKYCCIWTSTESSLSTFSSLVNYESHH